MKKRLKTVLSLLFLFCMSFSCMLNTVFAAEVLDFNPNDLTSLYDMMKDAAVLDDVIDYTQPSFEGENGNGIYLFQASKDDTYPIYYYRGNVNNNIAYKGRCWQIIRTTDTGSIKVLYRGVLKENGTCESGAKSEGYSGAEIAIGESAFNVGNNIYYNGYMYNDDIPSSNGEELNSLSNDELNVKDSSIKTLTDTWFYDTFVNSGDEYLSSIVKNLDDTGYCNDRMIWNENKVYFYSQARLTSDGFSRGMTISPILSCPRMEDNFTVSSSRGNGKLTYPVGHITGDELVLSGAEYNGLGKTDSYTLINKYWSMTPHSFTKLLYPNTQGIINRNSVTYKTYVRPVIALKYAYFDSGSGTLEDPYHVVDYFPPVDLTITTDISGDYLDQNKEYQYSIYYTHNGVSTSHSFQLGKGDSTVIKIDRGTSYRLVIEDEIESKFIYINGERATSKEYNGTIEEDNVSLPIVFHKDVAVPTGLSFANFGIYVSGIVLLIGCIFILKMKVSV